MGDRGNIVIRDNWPADVRDKEAVFLYTHWAGTELPETLRTALRAARERWGDSPYLARIVFETMTDHDRGQLTGYGISTQLTDNEYDLLVLHNERVYLLTEATYNDTGFATLDKTPSLSFDALSDALDDEMTWEIIGTLAQYVTA